LLVVGSLLRLSPRRAQGGKGVMIIFLKGGEKKKKEKKEGYNFSSQIKKGKQIPTHLARGGRRRRKITTTIKVPRLKLAP